MYANYVIQHILQYGRDSDRDSLLKIIVENDLLKLSRQKFASNVIEKLLKYGNAYQRNAIVREMLKVANEGTSQEGVGSTVLLLMVRDAYANYVVQTAIDVVPEGQEKRMLLDELKANEVQLVGVVSSLCCVLWCRFRHGSNPFPCPPVREAQLHLRQAHRGQARSPMRPG